MASGVSKSRKGWVGRLFQKWLNRRIPPVASLALSHRNVFILPSRTGWAFGGLVLAMLLTAINYQNSLIYGLTFWLVSLGHGTIWLTFQNLSGLEMTAGRVTPCYDLMKYLTLQKIHLILLLHFYHGHLLVE